MTTHQVALIAGLSFWSLLGVLAIYCGLRVRQNRMRQFPIVGYQPDKAADLLGLNKWVSNWLLLIGATSILGGLLASTVSIMFIYVIMVATSFFATKIQKGSARYY
jgi:hypothetical protein